MIYRNKRDQESWLREKTLDSLKTNIYLQENDIVQVAEDNNFYKIITSATDIVLQNNLFAEIIPSNIVGIITNAEKLNSLRNIKINGVVSGNNDFDGSKNIEISTNFSDGVVVNDLTTGGYDKVLSAEQGKILKQLIDSINVGGTTKLLRNARILGSNEIIGVLSAQSKSIVAGNRLYNPILYLDGVRIDSEMYDVDLDKGLITLHEVYSNYQVTWVIDDHFPHHIRFSYPTLNLLINDQTIKDIINIGDVIEITGESEADDGGHRLVKCENTQKLNGVKIAEGKFLNEVPNTKMTEFWNKTNFDPNTKANKTHTHLKNEITDFPLSLKNPHEFILKINGQSQGGYDGSTQKEINISLASLGAQPIGNYAEEFHNHKASDITTDNNHMFVTLAEKEKWDNRAGADHNHDDLYVKKTDISDMFEKCLSLLGDSFKGRYSPLESYYSGDIYYKDVSTSVKFIIPDKKTNSVSITIPSNSSPILNKVMTSEDKGETSNPIVNKQLNNINLNKFYRKTTDIEEVFDILSINSTNIVGVVIEGNRNPILKKFRY